MFTSFDKAIAAAVGGVLSVLVLLNVVSSDEAARWNQILTAGMGGVAPLVLTYFVPNKK